MNSTKINRFAGLDLVRSLAILFVIGVHTMMFLGIYSNEIDGPESFLEIFIFRFMWMCVPLFLMLTGYLNYKKEGDRKYYISILPLVGIFLFYSVLVLAFRSEYQLENISLIEGLKMILNNSTQDRAWYMNMYFGLVLIIPFLNRGWKMFSQKQKLVVIGVLYVLTFVSKYVYMLSGHFLETPIIIVSTYWWGLYYLVYYFIGAYIREYPINISRKKISMLLIVIMLVHTAVYFIMGYNKTYIDVFFSKDFWYDNPFLMIETTLFFLIIYKIEIKNKIFNMTNKEIALCSFEMYLLSIVTDTFCLKYFSPMLVNYPFLIVVLMMSISSFILAFLLTAFRRRYLSLKFFRKVIIH